MATINAKYQTVSAKSVKKKTNKVITCNKSEKDLKKVVANVSKQEAKKQKIAKAKARFEASNYCFTFHGKLVNFRIVKLTDLNVYRVVGLSKEVATFIRGNAEDSLIVESFLNLSNNSRSYDYRDHLFCNKKVTSQLSADVNHAMDGISFSMIDEVLFSTIKERESTEAERRMLFASNKSAKFAF